MEIKSGILLNHSGMRGLNVLIATDTVERATAVVDPSQHCGLYI